jgi:hypothetical protein
MANEALFAAVPIFTAPDRHRNDLISLMLPAMIPNLATSARVVAMGVTAQGVAFDAERRTVAVAAQAIEATRQLAETADKTELSDAELSSRPALASLVKFSPDLKLHIEGNARAIKENLESRAQGAAPGPTGGPA